MEWMTNNSHVVYCLSLVVASLICFRIAVVVCFGFTLFDVSLLLSLCWLLLLFNVVCCWLIVV